MVDSARVATFIGLRHVSEFWNIINCKAQPAHPVISTTGLKRDHFHQIFRLNCTSIEIISNMKLHITKILL